MPAGAMATRLIVRRAVMRRFFVAIPVAILALGTSTACASKKFVRSSVGDLNDKIDSLGRSIEETQERTRANERQISEVDKKTQAADRAAQNASGVASQAAYSARVANLKMDVLNTASKRLVYDLVLSDENGHFKFSKAELPDRAKTRIDQLIRQLQQDPKNVYIEIEGHTDNIGKPEVNRKIGLARAEAVQRYLYDQYHIPLHKMSVISYGNEKPIATNSTREGRAQNRRVVIRILS
jgi:outer membrane protein OmpA-like peptidoglycan-associated protein